MKKPRNHNRPYSKRDDLMIIRRWCHITIATIAKLLGRTPDGVARRAKRLGLKAPHYYYIGLNEAGRILGYEPRAVCMIAERAGILIKSKRLPAVNSRNGGRRGSYIGFDTDDIEAMKEVIRSSPHPNRITRTNSGEWGTGNKPSSCLDCCSSDSNHKARGLCDACYNKRIRGKLGFYDRPKVKRGTVTKPYKKATF